MAAIELPALPPEEAIAYFRAKGHHLSPTFSWHDAWQADHATAFTVAKSAGFDILTDIHQATLAGLQNGTGFDEFARNLVPTLQAKGWWGRKAVIDPGHPELGPQMAQLGSIRRLKTIYDTNIRMAYAAGRWNQIARNAAERPYLRYVAVLDSKTRPEHRRWHGTILRWDHPWWKTHFPPNGWFCRCDVQQLSEEDLARYGWEVSEEPPEDPPPSLYTNPRTGEVTPVPEGVDPGFAYNPGETALDAHAARVAVTKWVDAPPDLVAADQAASIEYLRPLLVRDFGGWVDALAAQIGEKDFRTRGDLRVIGALTRDVLNFLAERSIEPESGAVTITDAVAVHMLRDAKVHRGAALPIDDLRQLPAIIADPERILWDTTDPALLYVYDADEKMGKVVVVVDFRGKAQRTKVVTNAIRTGGLVQPNNLDATLPGGAPRYINVGNTP